MVNRRIAITEDVNYDELKIQIDEEIVSRHVQRNLAAGDHLCDQVHHQCDLVFGAGILVLRPAIALQAACASDGDTLEHFVLTGGLSQSIHVLHIPGRGERDISIRMDR